MNRVEWDIAEDALYRATGEDADDGPLAAALRKLLDDEPPGAGADPFGRPDPQTHPEFWTE